MEIAIVVGVVWLVLSVVVGVLVGRAIRLRDQQKPAEPGYERIADAIDNALKTADLRIELKTGTGSDWGRFTDSYSRQLYVLARTLDKAGLIDWAALDGDR
jgi:hypothetical protein